MAWVPAILAIGGAVYQGMAAKQQAETGADIAKYNASVAMQQKKLEGKSAAEKANMLRDRMRKDLARNQTLTAGSGWQSTGSPMEVQLGVIDTYAHEIGMSDYESRIKQSQFASQAKFFGYQAKAAKAAGKLGIGQAVVGGARNYYQMSMYEKLNT